MCFPKARFSKYSTMPAAAWAVQAPRSSWFSIGEHHSRRSEVPTLRVRDFPLPEAELNLRSEVVEGSLSFLLKEVICLLEGV